MHRMVIGLVLASMLLAGCADVPGADLRLAVERATVDEGDCTFGVRDQASDPEWCHVLDVVVTNRGRAAADLASDRWRAEADDGSVHLLPRVEGQTQVSPQDRVEITLRFSVGPDVRLSVLHFEDPAGALYAETTLRSY